MKYVDEYRDRELVLSLAEKLHHITHRRMRIMEVCGTHTMSIFRHGLKHMLPEAIELVSGPGCPVCVTPTETIDAFIRLAAMPEVTVATFGDMIRVPGRTESLADARAHGADVRIVYSPMDAVNIARKERDRLVVFLSVGFETTTPAIAASVLQAAHEKIDNFCIFPANKVMPPPLDALMQDKEVRVDALLCPGHVSVIIGSDAYKFLPERYGLACAVAGFEPADILVAIISLVRQIQDERPLVENCYGRAVTRRGNERARNIVNTVFKPADSRWRGLGTIEASGLAVRTEFESFDINSRIDLNIPPADEPKGCLCGSILKGTNRPTDCPLFGKACTPSRPVGPCMVSSEGTCAAWFRYGRH